jgi:hypothetical protein
MDRLADKLGRLVLNETWQLEDRPLRPGSSGQAWLFGARVRSTDERVVVKIFKPARSLDFEREIGALKKLSTGMSARTAPFIGHGTVEHSGLQLQFIVMGFVEGLPLDELLAADLFDLDERLEILVQIAVFLSASSKRRASPRHASYDSAVPEAAPRCVAPARRRGLALRSRPWRAAGRAALGCLAPTRAAARDVLMVGHGHGQRSWSEGASKGATADADRSLRACPLVVLACARLWGDPFLLRL